MKHTEVQYCTLHQKSVFASYLVNLKIQTSSTKLNLCRMALSVKTWVNVPEYLEDDPQISLVKLRGFPIRASSPVARRLKEWEWGGGAGPFPWCAYQTQKVISQTWSCQRSVYCLISTKDKTAGFTFYTAVLLETICTSVFCVHKKSCTVSTCFYRS